MPPRFNILFLPNCYPTERDRQYGVFVKKHAHAVSRYCNVTVVNVVAGDVDRMASIMDGEIYYVEAQYKRTFNPLLNLYRYLQAAKKGVQLAMEKYGSVHLAHVHVLNRPALVARWLKKTYAIPY